MNPLLEKRQLFPSPCLFLLLNKSFDYKWEICRLQCCNCSEFHASQKCSQAGRKVKGRAIQGTNVVFSAAVCSLLFFFSPPLSHIYPIVPSHFFGWLCELHLGHCSQSVSNSNIHALFSVSDHQFIKRLHATEIIRGIPGCVSFSFRTCNVFMTLSYIRLNGS